MSDFDPDSHEEVARRLREQGPAKAPPDLAGEVMRRVRSEPRGSTSSARRPVVTLLAAAVVIAALLVGVSRLGGGSSSSAGSVGGGGVSGLTPSRTPQAEAGIVESKVIREVPARAIGHLPFAAMDSVVPGSCYGPALTSAKRLSISVPYSAWEAATAQLENARLLDPYAARRVTVTLHRLALGAHTAGAAITCP
jgi:hypothetical protein